MYFFPQRYGQFNIVIRIFPGCISQLNNPEWIWCEILLLSVVEGIELINLLKWMLFNLNLPRLLMFIIYFLCRLKMPCLCLTRQQIAIEVIEDRYIPANLTGLKIYLLQNMVILILKEMQNLLVTIATLPHIIYSYFVKPKIKFCCKNRWDIFIKHFFCLCNRQAFC